MKIGSGRSPLMGKFCIARTVWTPYSALSGTGSSPSGSFSARVAWVMDRGTGEKGKRAPAAAVPNGTEPPARDDRLGRVRRVFVVLRNDDQTGRAVVLDRALPTIGAHVPWSRQRLVPYPRDGSRNVAHTVVQQGAIHLDVDRVAGPGGRGVKSNREHHRRSIARRRRPRNNHRIRIRVAVDGRDRVRDRCRG